MLATPETSGIPPSTLWMRYERVSSAPYTEVDGDVGRLRVLPGSVSIAARVLAVKIPISPGPIFWWGCSNNSTPGVLLRVNEGGVLQGVLGNGSSRLAATSASGVVLTNTWFDAVLVWETGVSLRIYIDSVLVQTAPAAGFAPVNSPVNPMFSRDRVIPADGLNSGLDDIAYWGRALSQGDIDNYGAGVIPTAGLLSHWGFEEGTAGQDATAPGSILDTLGYHSASPIHVNVWPQYRAVT